MTKSTMSDIVNYCKERLLLPINAWYIATYKVFSKWLQEDRRLNITQQLRAEEYTKD